MILSGDCEGTENIFVFIIPFLLFLAFAGFAALLSATSKTFTTQGGNDVFVRTLLTAANASVSLSSRVTGIEKSSGM